MAHWEIIYITTNRGRFECFIAGQGKPLCVAHLYQQFTSEGNAFIDVLAEYYHVIAVNLKEAGKSSRARRRSDLSMDESVKDLESIRVKMGYGTWSYAGHSTGGFLGLKYLIAEEDHLDSIILSGTAASRDFQYSKECIYNFRDGKHRKEIGKIWRDMLLPFSSSQKKQSARRRLIEISLYKPENYNTYFPNPKSTTDVVGKRMRAYIRDLKNYDTRQELKEATIPILVLCGRHDVQCPVENSYEIDALAPNSTLVIFNESNHFPFLEEPNKFRAAIEAFVN